MCTTPGWVSALKVARGKKLTLSHFSLTNWSGKSSAAAGTSQASTFLPKVSRRHAGLLNSITRRPGNRMHSNQTRKAYTERKRGNKEQNITYYFGKKKGIEKNRLSWKKGKIWSEQNILIGKSVETAWKKGEKSPTTQRVTGNPCSWNQEKRDYKVSIDRNRKWWFSWVYYEQKRTKTHRPDHNASVILKTEPRVHANQKASKRRWQTNKNSNRIKRFQGW